MNLPDSSLPSTLGSATEALDGAALSRLHELDPDGRNGVVRRVLLTYQGSLTTSLPRLDAAASRSDAAELVQLAHMLKSASASVGALQFSAQCAAVERLARGGWCDDLSGLVAALLHEGQRVQSALLLHLRA